MNTTQEEIISFLNETQDHLFITGGAGTGKSYLTNQWLSEIPEEEVSICAPTGIAALNISGQTLHRSFNIPFNIVNVEYQSTVAARTMKYSKKQYLRAIEYLIIDEISMARSDVLDFVEAVLRNVRDNPFPWGGVRLIAIGDPYQLPPVVPRHEESKLPRPWFFQGEAWTLEEIKTLNLTKIYRQQGDPIFAELLNKVRTGDISRRSELITLTKRKKADPDPLAVILGTTNKRVNAINMRELERLPGEERTFIMEYENFTEDYHIEKNVPAPIELTLKEDCRIMLLNNNYNSDGFWVNGSLGTIQGFHTSGEKDKYIEVLLDNGEEVKVRPFIWFASDAEMEGDSKLVHTPLGEATQYPMKLGYAITVHKSQGLTFENMHFDIGYIFERGQLYVGLSRATSLEALSLSRAVSMDMIKVDPFVKKFMKET